MHSIVIPNKQCYKLYYLLLVVVFFFIQIRLHLLPQHFHRYEYGNNEEHDYQPINFYITMKYIDIVYAIYS